MSKSYHQITVPSHYLNTTHLNLTTFSSVYDSLSNHSEPFKMVINKHRYQLSQQVPNTPKAASFWMIRRQLYSFRDDRTCPVLYTPFWFALQTYKWINHKLCCHMFIESRHSWVKFFWCKDSWRPYSTTHCQ